MKSLFQVLWPLSVIVLLALMVLQRGGNGVENPLGDHRVDEWLSVSKR